MRISGSYSVPIEQEGTYNRLQDPVVLAACIPGCEQLNKTGENEYEMRMKVLISSIQGLFTGTVKIADQKLPESFRLIVDGTGKLGFVRGDGVLTLVPSASSTEVRYDGEVKVGGTIASVGQRLLDVTAKFIIKKFFGKFQEIASGKNEGRGEGRTATPWAT